MENKTEAGVFQLPNGNWGFRFKAKINGKVCDRRFVRNSEGKPFRTQQAASRARRIALEKEKKDQDDRLREEQRVQYALSAFSRSPMTVEEVFGEYCEKGRSDRAYATIRKQDSIWANHLREAFGKRYVTDINTAEICDYLADLYYINDYSYQYVESFLKMFYLIFGQAYSRGYLGIDEYDRLCKNRDTKIHMPKLKTDDDLNIVAFSDEECAIMDQYFKGTNAETAYLLGRYCGLRINECYGLKWSQVDLEAGTISIRQQMAYQNGLIRLVPLKTKNAKRTVYLNSILIEYFRKLRNGLDHLTDLERQQREQNQKFINEAGRKVSSLELVNCLQNGKIQTVNSMKYHSRELKSKYGINFKYHHLRHTYGTQLAVLNTPTHILCAQMGHGNINVTMRYYVAVSKTGIEVLKKNLEKISETVEK